MLRIACRSISGWHALNEGKGVENFAKFHALRRLRACHPSRNAKPRTPWGPLISGTVGENREYK